MRDTYHSRSGIFDLSEEEREALTEEEKETGISTMKDNMSRILLTVSFKHLLEGKISQAEHVQKSVDMNCSSRIRDNRVKENEKAKARAVAELTD